MSSSKETESNAMADVEYVPLWGNVPTSQAWSRSAKVVVCILSVYNIIVTMFALNIIFPVLSLNIHHQYQHQQGHEYESDSSSYPPPTMLGTLNKMVKWHVSRPAWDAWETSDWFGPFDEDLENRWEDLIYHDSHHTLGMRFSREEAFDLGFEESLQLEDGGFMGVFGAMHNLHCLRRMRQWIHSDQFYPNETEEHAIAEKGHVLHCLAGILDSMVCHADLSIHPYSWDTTKDSPVVVRADAKQHCVDWESLKNINSNHEWNPKELAAHHVAASP